MLLSVSLPGLSRPAITAGWRGRGSAHSLVPKLELQPFVPLVEKYAPNLEVSAPAPAAALAPAAAPETVPAAAAAPAVTSKDERKD